MSRIVNYASAGKERIRLTKAIVVAIRELAQKTGPGTESRDLAAFIALALSTIFETIEISVAAWEKRGYWVKADRFRLDWAWTGKLADIMRCAVMAEDWAMIATTAAQVAGRLNKVTVPTGHRLGRPWIGAWNLLHKQEKANNS